MVVLTNIAKFVDTIQFFLESDLCPDTECPILIPPYSNYPEKYILFNVEQLSSNRQLNKFLEYYRKGSPVEVWDYSQANINILRFVGIQAKYIPIKSPPWYLDRLRQFRKEIPTYDVGFNGLLTPRRKKILDELQQKGIRVNMIIKVYGKYRDEQLAKCKMLVNIHACDDYKIFEINRCEPWLAIGVQIISENSIDNDPRCINVEYDEIVKTILEKVKSI